MASVARRRRCSGSTCLRSIITLPASGEAVWAMASSWRNPIDVGPWAPVTSRLCAARRRPGTVARIEDGERLPRHQALRDAAHALVEGPPVERAVGDEQIAGRAL